VPNFAYPQQVIQLFDINSPWLVPRSVFTLIDLEQVRLLTVVDARSKPPANLPEVRYLFTYFTLTYTQLSSGKAPRKQLATKAARKTATVRHHTRCHRRQCRHTQLLLHRLPLVV